MLRPFWKVLGLYAVLAAATVPLVLGWVPPNRWYGFRFPGAQENRALWYALNASGGRHLLVALILCVLANLLIVKLGTDRMVRGLGWINAGMIALSFWWVTLDLLGQLP